MSAKNETKPEMIHVLIIEDYELASLGLRMALLARGNICVVGEAKNGLLGVQTALQETPDVVLMYIDRYA